MSMCKIRDDPYLFHVSNSMSISISISKSVFYRRPGHPDSLAISLAYSFVHAQVHYPSNPQQPGPLFFKTPRKCGIFGVCSEGRNSQVNYLIDESQSCGKGANISLVWCTTTCVILPMVKKSSVSTQITA